MKALYFKPEKYSAPIKVINYFLLSMDRHMPRLNHAVLKNMLLKPRDSKKAARAKNTVFNTAIEGGLIFNTHEIKTYYWENTGPIVLLVHGWAGNAKQFTSLIEELLAKGYSVFTFDQLAHGLSKGKQANIILLTKLLQQMIPHVLEYGNIHAIMAHSLGAATALNLVEELQSIKHLVLFAPLTYVESSIIKTTGQLGLHRSLIQNFLNAVAATYQVKIKDFDPSQQFKTPSTNVHLIHCKDDRHISLTEIETYSEKRKNFFKNIKYTEKLGHRRVLKDPKTISTVLNWIR